MCLYQSLPAKASRPTLRSGPDPTRQNQTLVSPLDWTGCTILSVDVVVALQLSLMLVLMLSKREVPPLNLVFGFGLWNW